MKKIIRSKNCIVNYSDSLGELANETIMLLEDKIVEYNSLFGKTLEEPVIVNYFDNLEEFRNFIYEIRGENESLPEYATGTYDNDMVNAYIEPHTQIKRKYTACHELFHILYMKYILKDNYSKRIVWYDEGMAQFMSGEKNLNSAESFKQFYKNVKNETKIIPNLNEIKHGNTFCNEQYNGYNLSYLAIKYLNDILSKKEFKNMMSDFIKIKEIGKEVIIKAFEYYDSLIN